MQKRGGAYARATGECLAFDAALVGTKNKAVWRENLGEIRICALRAECFVPPKS